jgi:processive 1,2-diacylglycerol beta-glucosyltransferase
MKKVLIIYASAGDGHKKAAEAIYKSFLELEPDVLAVPIDALNYTTRFFKFFYKRTYIVLIKRFPWLWGFFYKVLNNRFFFLVAAPFRCIANASNSIKLKEFLLKEDFDIIVSTHFFASYVISRFKQKNRLSARLVSVVTDFKPHLFWIAKNTDIYIVASKSTRQGFIETGIQAEKIKVLGIPVRKQFACPESKQEARKKLGLSEDRLTILVMRGGLGVGPIKDILLNLRKLAMDYQAIAVCGHNKELCQDLESTFAGTKQRIKIIGFSHNIGRLMSASDIIISKAGGITVSESMAIGLPLVCINPIPGQESANMEFLIEEKIGFKAKTLDDINKEINDIWQSPVQAEILINNIKKASRPHAAEDIVRLAKEMII